MNNKTRVVVAGLGEVGRPILELVSEQHNTVGVDISPPTDRARKLMSCTSAIRSRLATLWVRLPDTSSFISRR